MLSQREVRAFIETTRAASAARYRRRQGFLDLLESAFTSALTERRVVGYRRYRGGAAVSQARARGVQGFSSNRIFSVPIYRDVPPPPGLARALAFQLI